MNVRLPRALALMLALFIPQILVAAGVTIAVTGDLDNSGTSKGNAKRVSDLILAQNPLDAVLLVGDTCNATPTPIEEYRKLYKGTFDRVMPKLFPAPGNHDKLSDPPFSAYGEFWGAAAHAPDLYYSFDLGNWHIVSLDSVTFRDGGAATEKQLEWLKHDLAANSRKPVIAYWHYPLFSQAKHGGDPAMKPLWEALVAHGPALVFNGHNHVYERYPPLDADGKPVNAAKGIQEFVICPGGAPPIDGQRPGVTSVSTVFDGGAHHVGFFTLQPDGAFQFTVKAMDKKGVVTTVDQGSGKLTMP